MLRDLRKGTGMKRNEPTNLDLACGLLTMIALASVTWAITAIL